MIPAAADDASLGIAESQHATQALSGRSARPLPDVPPRSTKPSVHSGRRLSAPACSAVTPTQHSYPAESKGPILLDRYAIRIVVGRAPDYSPATWSAPCCVHGIIVATFFGVARDAPTVCRPIHQPEHPLVWALPMNLACRGVITPPPEVTAYSSSSSTINARTNLPLRPAMTVSTPLVSCGPVLGIPRSRYVSASDVATSR